MAAERIGTKHAGILAPLAGGLIAFSLPPWGWWPLTFVGVALWSRLLAGQPARARAVRSFVVGLWWLFPAMFWMLDLTPPGYFIAGLLYSSMYALGAALVPPSERGRAIGLPAMLVVVAALRWNWPFGGVPLASLAISQADAPLAPTARLFTSLTIVALVGVVGFAVDAATRRSWRAVAIATAVVLGTWLLAGVAPDGRAVATLDVALVQGGGPQNTRAGDTSAREVFERHVQATGSIEGSPDLVLWPENVITTVGPFAESGLYPEVAQLADRLDAPFVVGIFEVFRDEGYNLNAQITVLPDGTISSRYDKLRRVPFGEYVPFRGLIERVAPEFLPARDARAGTGPAIIDTGEGLAGVMISWEVFHDDRGFSGAANGGEILLNPTNGSSFWLTILQTQQINASRLRAIETGRWLLQAAPTGFSAIVTPDGDVIDRTGISEAAVVQGTVERRTGRTWTVALGWWPPVIAAAVALAAVNAIEREMLSTATNKT